jgi:glycosyltransferase involved in cell wall biosynthesis
LRERSFIRSICEKHKIHIVHTHGYRPAIVDSGVARRMGLATVSTEHGMSKMGGRTRFYEWLQMRLFRKLDAVVAVSQSIAEALERSGVDPQRIHVIPNAWAGGVDFLARGAARAALQLSSDSVVIGWVGRLIHAKGADVFLSALAELRDLSVQAAIIGDGPERVALEALRDELGLTTSVRFYGAMPDARRCFRAFDVFALSSRTEGTPIVIFEAMAANVPLVATAVGGVPDVLTAEVGLVVPSENFRRLANALRSALEAPNDANDRAERARERLHEIYAIEPWLDQHQRIYRSAIAMSGPR